MEAMMSKTSKKTADLIGVVGKNARVIAYRPEFNEITNSATASLLLSQIIYWWVWTGRKPFFKFSAPCDHAMYKDGDSWQEELRFSRTEFETARSKIGTKINRNTDKSEVQKTRLVIYWRDTNNLTWYEVNEELLRQKLDEIYSECRKPTFGNAGNLHSVMEETCIPLTETTTKITTKNNTFFNNTFFNDNDLDVLDEEELSDNSHELSPAIAEQKILFSLGEKKNGNDAKLNTQSVNSNKPPKSNKSGELSPTTPGAILLFAKLTNERRAKGRKPAVGFASIAQRDAFLEVEERLTINQLEQAIDNALRNEITVRRSIINYLSKYKVRSVHAPALGYKHTTIVNEDGSVYF
jgi:hypothetical protein